jgi:hypothetical protein
MKTPARCGIMTADFMAYMSIRDLNGWFVSQNCMVPQIVACIEMVVRFILPSTLSLQSRFFVVRLVLLQSYDLC